ncbi:MAG: hypothetical protein LBM75_07385 [Myxococcales bacterium]|jgi:predicted HTH transcriptional regulator|nr:hypothetical protein [Myxococcales bacterium]
MNLATGNGVLSLAGLLLFGEEPHRFKPQFGVKAVECPGTGIHTSKDDDTEDFSGALGRVGPGKGGFWKLVPPKRRGK